MKGTDEAFSHKLQDVLTTEERDLLYGVTKKD